MFNEIQKTMAIKAVAQLLIAGLRYLADRSENQLDDKAVDAIEAALSIYL